MANNLTIPTNFSLITMYLKGLSSSKRSRENTAGFLITLLESSV